LLSGDNGATDKTSCFSVHYDLYIAAKKQA